MRSRSPGVEPAVEYTRRGWRVLPLRPREKTPLIREWQHKATTDESEIREWWTRWPDANIGVACGGETGFFVLDIDGPDGERSLAELRQEFPEFSGDTLEQVTGRPGGRHLFFKYPPDREIRNTVALRPGFDIRGEGGYIVVPPSIHPNGATYTWADEPTTPIQRAPIELLNIISTPNASGAAAEPTETQHSPTSAPPGADAAAPGRDRAYLRGALAREAAAVARAAKGCRNDELNKAAFSLGQLIDAGLSEDDVVHALRSAARQCGLPEQEAHDTIASGIKAGRKQPRKVPPLPVDSTLDESGTISDASPDDGEADPVINAAGWRPFPIECFPSCIQTLVRTVAIAHSVDESFVILPLLSTTSAALGAKFRLRVKDGFELPPTLWSALVAETGSNKSGPLEVVTGPMWRPPPFPDFDVGPPALVQSEWAVVNATIEAVLARLKECPHGLLLIADEMSEWLGSFNAYKKGKGADQTTWIALWNGKPYAVDRKTNRERIFLSAPSVAVAGAIQPELLKKSTDAEKMASGFFARTLLAMPPPRKREWNESGVASEVIEIWSKAVDEMRCRTFAGEDAVTGQFTPNIVRISAEARHVWVDHYKAVADRVFEATGIEKVLASKYDVHAGRLALVHHGLRCATGEVDWGAELSVESMKAGAQMALWFLNETLHVFESLCGRAQEEQRKRLVRLVKKKGGSLTVRESMRANDRFKSSAEYARAALQDLAQAGLGEFSENRFTLKPSGEQLQEECNADKKPTSPR